MSLAWLYVVLFLSTVVQLTRIIYYRHRLFAFQGGFLLLCALWTALRVVFWFADDLDTWPLWLSDLVYTSCTVLQCATFSLLIIFYAKLASPSSRAWKQKQSTYATVYALANLATLAVSIIFSGISNQRNDTRTAQESKRSVDRLYFISSSIYFAVLVALAAYYVARLWRRARRSAPVRNAKRTVVFTSLVFVIFASRALFDLITAIGTMHAMHVYSSGPSTSKRIQPEAFALFFAWEIVPAAMILLYFRAIPATRVPLCEQWVRGCCPCLQRHIFSSESPLPHSSRAAESEEEQQHFHHVDPLDSPRSRRHHSARDRLLSSEDGSLLSDDDALPSAAARSTNWRATGQLSLTHDMHPAPVAQQPTPHGSNPAAFWNDPNRYDSDVGSLSYTSGHDSLVN